MRILGRLIQHPLTFSNPSCFSSPQLRDVDINRVSGDELEAAKRRRVDRDVDEGDVIAAEDVSIRGRDTITMPTEPSTSSREVKGAGLKIEQSANAARGQPVSDNHTESQQNYPKRRRRSTAAGGFPLCRYRARTSACTTHSSRCSKSGRCYASDSNRAPPTWCVPPWRP